MDPSATTLAQAVSNVPYDVDDRGDGAVDGEDTRTRDTARPGSGADEDGDDVANVDAGDRGDEDTKTSPADLADDSIKSADDVAVSKASATPEGDLDGTDRLEGSGAALGGEVGSAADMEAAEPSGVDAYGGIGEYGSDAWHGDAAAAKVSGGGDAGAEDVETPYNAGEAAATQSDGDLEAAATAVVAVAPETGAGGSGDEDGYDRAGAAADNGGTAADAVAAGGGDGDDGEYGDAAGGGDGDDGGYGNADGSVLGGGGDLRGVGSGEEDSRELPSSRDRGGDEDAAQPTITEEAEAEAQAEASGTVRAPPAGNELGYELGRQISGRMASDSGSAAGATTAAVAGEDARRSDGDVGLLRVGYSTSGNYRYVPTPEVEPGEGLQEVPGSRRTSMGVDGVIVPAEPGPGARQPDEDAGGGGVYDKASSGDAADVSGSAGRRSDADGSNLGAGGDAEPAAEVGDGGGGEPAAAAEGSRTSGSFNGERSAAASTSYIGRPSGDGVGAWTFGASAVLRQGSGRLSSAGSRAGDQLPPSHRGQRRASYVSPVYDEYERSESSSSSEPRPPRPRASNALSSASSLSRQLSGTANAGAGTTTARSASAASHRSSADVPALAAGGGAGSRTSSRPASGEASGAGDGGGGTADSRGASRSVSATSRASVTAAATAAATAVAASASSASRRSSSVSETSAAGGGFAASAAEDGTGSAMSSRRASVVSAVSGVAACSRPGSVTYSWRTSGADDGGGGGGAAASSRPDSYDTQSRATASLTIPTSISATSVPVASSTSVGSFRTTYGSATAQYDPTASAPLLPRLASHADGSGGSSSSLMYGNLGSVARPMSQDAGLAAAAATGSASPPPPPTAMSSSTRPPLPSNSSVNLTLGPRPRSAVSAPAGDAASGGPGSAGRVVRKHLTGTHVQPKGPLDECTVQAASQHVRTVWSTSNICGIRSLPNALSPDFRDRLYEALVHAAHKEQEERAKSEHKATLSYGLEGGPLAMPLSVGQKQVARINPLAGMFTQYEYLPSEYDRVKLTGKYDRLKHKLAQTAPEEFIVRATPQALKGAPAFSQFTYTNDPVDSYASCMNANADLARSKVVAGPFYPAGRINYSHVLKGRLDECMMRLCKHLSQDWPASFMQVFEDHNGSVVVSFHRGRAVEEGDLSSYMNMLAKQNHVVATYQLLKDATQWGLVDEESQMVFYVLWPPWVRHRYLGGHTAAACTESSNGRPGTRGSTGSGGEDGEAAGEECGAGQGQGCGPGAGTEVGEGSITGGVGFAGQAGDPYGRSTSQLRLGAF